MTEHTPGPWEVNHDHPELITEIVGTDNGEEIAWLNDERGNYLSNARLIAAAPELLEALQDLLTFVDPNENLIGQHMEIDVARHVIDKARGRK